MDAPDKPQMGTAATWPPVPSTPPGLADGALRAAADKQMAGARNVGFCVEDHDHDQFKCIPPPGWRKRSMTGAPSNGSLRVPENIAKMSNDIIAWQYMRAACDEFEAVPANESELREARANAKRLLRLALAHLEA